MPAVSVLEYLGVSTDGTCGYCKGTRGSMKSSLGTVEGDDKGVSTSLGAWAHSLQPPVYQRLLDCGWRRSGKYVYKPIMDKTCCPQYTIRLDSSAFYLSRAQRRSLRQMNEYLKNDKKPAHTNEHSDGNISEPTVTERTENAGMRESSTIGTKKDKSGNVVQKKKGIRRQRCFDRWRSRGIDVEKAQDDRRKKEESRRRTIESYTLPWQPDWKHKLEVKLVRTDSEEGLTRADESFALYTKYQSTIHNDTDKTVAGYKRFLLHTPLNSDNVEPDADMDDRPPLGSYHQWYILDGRLIAVGVVDILPHCYSSKYLFYDPDFNFLNMGTYTALREIAYVRHLSITRPSLKYYYMGYYIPSCPKMRYKGRFRPSELLCDKTGEWVPLSECEMQLDANDCKFTVFRPNSPAAQRIELSNLLLLVNGELVRYLNLPHLIEGYAEKETADIREKLTTFARYVSPAVSTCALYLDDINKMIKEEPE